MTGAETAFLAMALTGFAAFGLVLAWAERKTRKDPQA